MLRNQYWDHTGTFVNHRMYESREVNSQLSGVSLCFRKLQRCHATKTINHKLAAILTCYAMPTLFLSPYQASSPQFALWCRRTLC